MNKTNLTIETSGAGKRLDLILAEKFPEYSRNYFGNLIKAGNVLVNQKNGKASYLAKTGDQIEVQFLEVSKISLEPENIALDIIYEDSDVIVINKQPGLVVHPASGSVSNTLINALLYHFPRIKEAVYEKGSEISEARPGLVHRLDKDTSGVLIVAKNAKTMYSLAKQIQDRNVTKIYWALCAGWPKKEEGQLVNFLGRNPKERKTYAEVGESKGRKAISDYKVLKYLEGKSGNKISLIEFDIKTGRTHQIRVQAKILGTPIIGDNVYTTKESVIISKKLCAQRQMLHAKCLAISLPEDKEPRQFYAPLPDDFQNILNQLKELI